MKPAASNDACGPALLVAQTSFLGDVVLTTPLVSALRRRLMPRRLALLVRPEAVPLVAGHPDIDQVLVDGKLGAEGLRGRDRCARRRGRALRRPRCPGRGGARRGDRPPGRRPRHGARRAHGSRHPGRGRRPPGAPGCQRQRAHAHRLRARRPGGGGLLRHHTRARLRAVGSARGRGGGGHRERAGGPRRTRLSHRAGGDRLRNHAPAPARTRSPGAARRRAASPADRPHARAGGGRRARAAAPGAVGDERRADARRCGRRARRAGGDARRAAARAARPPAPVAPRRPAAGGERARAAGARAGGRVLGALDARRAGRLSRPGRLRQALGDTPGGGSAPAVRVPASYALLRSGAVRAAIRSDLVPALAAWLLAPRLELPPGAAPIASGRGPAYRMRLGDGAPVVVRICRRGGLAARLVRETYLGLRPRPLRELALTVEARRRGVAAAEVLAARVEGRLAYRGALVTAEVPAAATLLEALRGAPDRAARRGLAAAAGRAVAGLHAAGVFHADLNLRNILVHPGPEGVRAALLDFDRAWLGAPPLRSAARRRNLRRLARSLAKLDPGGQLAGAEERRAFRDAYTDHDPRLALGDACGC